MEKGPAMRPAGKRGRATRRHATLAGVLVKLRRQEWAQDGDEERMSNLVQSVAVDIERMMGGRAI